MRVLILCDPPQTLAVETDTTLAIAGELAGRGHEVQLSTASELHFEDGSVRTGSVDVAVFDAVLVRVDPPVDEAYLHMTQLLDLVGSQTFMVNSPAGLRAANEKLFILGFPELIARDDRERLAVRAAVVHRACRHRCRQAAGRLWRAGSRPSAPR